MITFNLNKCLNTKNKINLSKERLVMSLSMSYPAII